MSTVIYHPYVTHSSSNNLSKRQRRINNCIEDNPEWEAISLADKEFTEEQVEAIQLCATETEQRINENIANVMPWVGLGTLVVVVLVLCYLKAADL